METRKGKALGLGDAAWPQGPGPEQTLSSWQPWEASGGGRGGACCPETWALLPQLLSRLPGRLLRSPAVPGWHLQGEHMLLLPVTDRPPWESSGAVTCARCELPSPRRHCHWAEVARPASNSLAAPPTLV